MINEIFSNITHFNYNHILNVWQNEKKNTTLIHQRNKYKYTITVSK